MKHVSTFRLAALAALLGMTSLAVMAAVDPQELTIREIVAQQTQLRQQVVAGTGAFKDLSTGERKVLVERQDRVLRQLDSTQAFEQLAPHERTEIFNDLEWIKAAVTKAEDDRKVCEYTRSVGSNRVRSVCMTAKEQREHRDHARSTLNRGQMCNASSKVCLGD
ncbi:MAG: hypothetical protein ABL934_18735 [Lysobacteraceae bacterium]